MFTKVNKYDNLKRIKMNEIFYFSSRLILYVTIAKFFSSFETLAIPLVGD